MSSVINEILRVNDSVHEYRNHLLFACTNGATENAGLENDGPSKSRGVENAGLEFDGPNSRTGKCRTGKCRTKRFRFLAVNLCVLYRVLKLYSSSAELEYSELLTNPQFVPSVTSELCSLMLLPALITANCSVSCRLYGAALTTIYSSVVRPFMARSLLTDLCEKIAVVGQSYSM